MNAAFGKIKAANPTLASKIEKQGYFITEQDLPKIENIDRLMQILVRTGSGRFICAAQDVKHFMDIIIEHDKLTNAGDYIRDVSIPA